MFCALLIWSAQSGSTQNVTGQWTFDDNYNALIGNDLTAPSGWTFEDDVIGGVPARVARFPQGTGANDYLTVLHGCGPNGGGIYVNQYTIIMDVFIPAGHDWVALMNTNESNANDADWYIRADGGMGIGGNYTDNDNPTRFIGGQWNRIALVIDTTRNYYASYVNGALQNICQITVARDGRFTLYSTNDSTPWFLLFAEGDPSGIYTSEGKINNLQVRDYAMSNGEIALLGGPTAGPIPVPVRISGNLQLEGLESGSGPIQNFTFDFRNALGETVFSRTQEVGADGEYTLKSIPRGNFTMHVKGTRYLAANVSTDTTAGDLSGVLVPLRVGDVTNDNIIDLFDLIEFFGSYGASPESPEWNNGLSDFNADNIVDLFDLILFFQNYGAQGDL
jgi:hypothetical protein